MTAPTYVVARARTDQLEEVADFNAAQHHPGPGGEPNPRVRARTLDLLSGVHPTAGLHRCWVALDRAGRVVGSVCVIPQVWAVDDTPVDVDGVEFLAVGAAHRDRGLARRLLAAAHADGAERGVALQALLGRVGLYHRFGYSALPLDGGLWQPRTPQSVRPDGYVVRPTRPDDLPAISGLGPDVGLRVERDLDVLRFELAGRSADSIFRRELLTVAGADGRVVGWATAVPSRPGLVDGVGWDPARLDGAGVLALLAHAGHTDLWLGSGHPLTALLARVERESRLWVRPADVVSLLEARRGAHASAAVSVSAAGRLWQLPGGATPWREVAPSRSALDAADVHLSADAFARVLLGVVDPATAADLDPEVEFRGDGSEAALDALLPPLAHHLWLLG